MKEKTNGFYWLKSGFLTIMQNMAGVLFGLGGFYLLVRVLSKHDFGVWTLYMSAITILEIVRSGLVQNGLIKFISGTESSEHPRIVSASFVISGGLTLVCIVLNLTLAPWLAGLWKSPELVHMLYAFNVMYILSGILSQFNCIEQANLNYSGVFASSFVRQALFFLYVLICFLTKHELNLTNLVYMQIVAAFVSLLVAGYYVRQHLSFKFSLSVDWIKKLFHYGKYAFGTSVSSILSGTIDQMMLGALLSPVASAAFNVAVRIINLVDIPTNALATIVFPQSAKRLETEGPGAVKYLYEKSVGTILAIFIPGLFFIFSFQAMWLNL
ncbi:oligosaccharide flippase family protein [Arcticibacter sp. MXS-1]|uniref:oligosaccharide flippase family protein n=1 Tax=Arcticibacter sp. MXS-1 TaxID=3341726 RepID=UPI0035A89B8A